MGSPIELLTKPKSTSINRTHCNDFFVLFNFMLSSIRPGSTLNIENAMKKKTFERFIFMVSKKPFQNSTFSC